MNGLVMESCITVIIPIFNVDRFVHKCLESIQKQEYKNFEVLMINDGSTDECEDICKGFAGIDERFKYYYQENQGVSAARNLGLSSAEGEFVVFVDADDWVEPTFLSDFIDHQRELGTLLIQDFVRDGTTGQKMLGVLKTLKYSLGIDFRALTQTDSFLEGFPFNKFYSREIIERHHLRFDQRITHREDEIFFQQYLIHIENLQFIPATNYHYVSREDSAMRRYPEFKSEYNFLLKFLDFTGFLENVVKDSSALKAYKKRKLNLYYKYLLYSILYNPVLRVNRRQRVQNLRDVFKIYLKIHSYLDLTIIQKTDSLLMRLKLFEALDFFFILRRSISG